MPGITGIPAENKNLILQDVAYSRRICIKVNPEGIIFRKRKFFREK
jgi:hypothetical protein